jgi:hypothetical protein
MNATVRSDAFAAHAVSGGVKRLLRVEGACVLLASIFAYSLYGSGWGVFFGCFLMPDLAMLAYFAGPRIGAFAYNTTHSYIGALLVLACGVVYALPQSTAVGLIWAAHIGFDRMLGYGLKYASGFGDTHLGRIGRSQRYG